MNIYTAEKIRQIDELTIQNEPISSVDLMERASQCFFRKFSEFFPPTVSVMVLCGPGNNGGDALAIARLLLDAGYSVSAFLIHSSSLSTDCSQNRERLLSKYPAKLQEITDSFVDPSNLTPDTVIIDGLFGSGLSRPLSGVFSDAVKWLNTVENKVVAVDVPSGMFCEDNNAENQLMVKADFTFTFQFPKIAFLLPEAGENAGQWFLLDIGLNAEAIESTNTNFFLHEKPFFTSIYKQRLKFSHKGTYGHSLIIAGSKGMAGASVLATKAALRSGAGLVTIHAPECNRLILQTAVPEAIFSADKNHDFVCSYPELKSYKAIGIGCGLGNSPETASMLEKLFTELFSPCVVDADALNIVARNKHFMDLLPEKSILTPHPKEFDRLFGNNETTWQRINKAIEISARYRVIIVLKGTCTAIITPDGKCAFNTTGNNGLATAGTGDVLTGIITGLLSQGYSPENASYLGVYLHGKAADLALELQSEESLIAGDVTEQLGKAFYTVK